MTRIEAKASYARAIELAEREGCLEEVMAELGRKDLFFLGIYILAVDPSFREYADNDWVYERCQEFGNDRDGFLDLWPREHFKSTIITCWGVIQEILRDPEITVGIFSYNRPIAKGFLRAIKWQFESNALLKELYKDILWEDPSREAPKWSEDDGIIVRRRGMPKESTVEAWGLVDGMPTSKHYGLGVYDDVVVPGSVTSPDMIRKTTEAISISFNLLKVPMRGQPRKWGAGTRYHYADTYHELLGRGAFKARLYQATVTGTLDGKPVMWAREVLDAKIREMGPYVSSCQLFNRPVMEGEQVFDPAWIQGWDPGKKMGPGVMPWSGMNRYILVDPSGEKKKDSDYTVMTVIGLGSDRNYYLIDMIRDRMDLRERKDALFALHAKYSPLAVGYEKYGMQADLDYMKESMDTEQYRFRIIPLGGSMAKNDRIRRIQPFFSEGRFFIPDELRYKPLKGPVMDLRKAFIEEEYSAFPYMAHDDMLDCMSRIAEEDLHAVFPQRKGNDGLPAWSNPSAGDTYDFDTYDYLEARA